MKYLSYITTCCLSLLFISCQDGNPFGDYHLPSSYRPFEGAEAKGSGTLADPYNYIAATQVVHALAFGQTTPKNFYIKGTVSEVEYPFDMEHGKAAFYISDDGTTPNQFLFDGAYYLGNTRWKEGDIQIQVGDEVIVYAYLPNYYGTEQAYVYSLNGQTKDEAKGSGTLADPFNYIAATQVASALAIGHTTSKEYYIKGTVSEVKYPFNVEHGSAAFYISDDGMTPKQFLIYSAYYLGDTSWKEGNIQIQVGDEVIVYGRLTNYNGTLETAEEQAYVYSLNGQTEDKAKGSGTLADPWNATAATHVASALEIGQTSSEKYYIKGKVSQVKYPFNVEHGTAVFYISDDGTTPNQFQIYSAYYLGNTSWKEGNIQIQIGDEVIVYGHLNNYNGTPETAKEQAYVYSLNGKTEDEAKGSGTLADPFNYIAATQIASALSIGQTTSEKYYIKGKISKIKYPFDVEYGTAVFYISDDGTTTNQFLILSAYYLGNTSWKEGQMQIQVGDDVIVFGHLTNHNGTPETAEKQAYVYSLNGKTEDDSPGFLTLADFTNGDFEAWTDGLPDGWKSASSASSAVLSQSTDAHGGRYSVKVTGTTSLNKRLAYQEMVLEAGSYSMVFYAKAATSIGGTIRPGYVPIKDEGYVGSYTYGDYVNDLGSEWVKIEHTFELAAKTTVCLVILNYKNPGADVLIDDFSIKKN